MRLIFELDNGKLSWTDTYDIDRYGNVSQVTGPLCARSERRFDIEQVELLLTTYFANVMAPNEGVKPRIEWPYPVDPVEATVFLSLQQKAQLVHPEFEPVASDQPPRH